MSIPSLQSRCSARTNLICLLSLENNRNGSLSHHADKFPFDKRYLYPIHRSPSCKKAVLNKIKQHDFAIASRVFTGKKGHVVASQRAQPVRESDSLFRKRQIKSVLTNIVAEHAKSRMSKSLRARDILTSKIARSRLIDPQIELRALRMSYSMSYKGAFCSKYFCFYTVSETFSQ